VGAETYAQQAIFVNHTPTRSRRWTRSWSRSVTACLCDAPVPLRGCPAGAAGGQGRHWQLLRWFPGCASRPRAAVSLPAPASAQPARPGCPRRLSAQLS